MLYFLSIFIKEDQYKCQQICIFILQRKLNACYDKTSVCQGNGKRWNEQVN
jgi:hypothetical protein